MMKTKGWKLAAWVLWALAALLALHLLFALCHRGGGRCAPASGPGAEMPEPFRWPALDSGWWQLFRSGAPLAPPSAAGALSARYRLAGVFLLLSETGRSEAEHRCAILDDLQSKKQYLATEEEWLDQVRVVRVESDHVVLSDGSHEETIVLAAGTLPGHGPPGAPPPPAGEETKILETNRFGNRIGETRWEFSRQAILDYYQEMMDNPERLAALFMAMEPDRDEEGKVAGYKLNLDVGEKEFYTQVGLQHGDVVRKVNSMRMTSQRRAEYFIGEFVQNRLGAVVFDIERNGEPQKLVYLIK
jgi:type II secretory pathway component PulC